jgi:hypothetical protein
LKREGKGRGASVVFDAGQKKPRKHIHILLAFTINENELIEEVCHYPILTSLSN